MGSALRRAATNFNVESRAHRLIDKNKIRRSPLHPTVIKKMKELENQITPEVKTAAHEKLHGRDSHLLGMLQDIRVQSTDPQPKNPDEKATETTSVSKDPILPQDRKAVPQPTSVLESQKVEIVPPGRLSVYMAQELLVKNKQNPMEYNAERLAKDYNLDLVDTKNITENFRTLKIIPMITTEVAELLREQEEEKRNVELMSTSVNWEAQRERMSSQSSDKTDKNN